MLSLFEWSPEAIVSKPFDFGQVSFQIQKAIEAKKQEHEIYEHLGAEQGPKGKLYARALSNRIKKLGALNASQADQIKSLQTEIVKAEQNGSDSVSIERLLSIFESLRAKDAACGLKDL